MNLFFKEAQQNFDHLQKEKEEKKRSENFNFIKVKRELTNFGAKSADDQLEKVLDDNGLLSNNKLNKSNCSEEGKFKRYARKRKHSNLLENMQRFMTTPDGAITPNTSFCKKRKMNIAYQLNDCTSKPTAYENDKNNPNLMNISFHGTTPTVSQKLKQRLFKENEILTQQSTQATQRMLTQQNPNDVNKLKAQKLRLENAQLTQSHNFNQRKQKQNDTLQSIKRLLSRDEYNTFKSVLKLIQKLKASKSTDERQFDECVITPFVALFSTPKRQHLIKELKRYIPSQFHKYYEDALMESSSENDQIESKLHEKKKRKINMKQNQHIYVSSQRTMKNISSGSGDIQRSNRNYSKRAKTLSQKQFVDKEIVLSMPSKENLKPAKHHSLDDTFVKLRKLQDQNADVSQPLNRHKRKKMNVTRNKGFEGLCKALMSDGHFEELKICLKEWKGIGANADRKEKLKKITDVLFKSCGNDIRNGHVSKFRSMAKALNKMLTKKGDQKIYHNLIQSADIMKEHLDKIRQRQKSRQEPINC